MACLKGKNFWAHPNQLMCSVLYVVSEVQSGEVKATQYKFSEDLSSCSFQLLNSAETVVCASLQDFLIIPRGLTLAIFMLMILEVPKLSFVPTTRVAMSLAFC